MKLIIDIDDNEYKGIKEYPNNITSYPVTIHIYDAVRNGIPLDDVKAEIIALPKTYPFINHIDTYVKEDDVLHILNNIGKAESEDKE